MATNITSNGQTDLTPFRGGEHVLMVWGTFDGATAKLQSSPDGVNWIDVVGASFGSDGQVQFALPGSVDLRIDTSGGGGSLDINVDFRPTRRL